MTPDASPHGAAEPPAPSQTSPSVTVIVPVYNESGLVEPAVEAIRAFLKSRSFDSEILLVESGSTDGTGDECDRVALRYADVRVVHEGVRRGFGAGIKRGFVDADKHLVWIVTADLPFPLDCLDQAVPLLPHYDCVLSYRSVDSRPPFRRIQGMVYNALVRNVLGLPMRHINSAFKLLKREDARRLAVRTDGWFFETELLYRIHTSGMTWTEIPVPLQDRVLGESKVSAFAFLSMLRELFILLVSNRK